MPSTDAYTSVMLISVAGQPIDAQVAARLEHGRVTDAANLPDSFELEFSDTTGDVITKAGFSIGAAVKISFSENGPGGPVVLIDGEVTALEREAMGGSLHTRVRGLDRSHRLFRGRRVRAFVDSTISDVVRTVVSAVGLNIGTIEAQSQVFEKITQDNVSDWVFLKRLADLSGATFSVADGVLSFGPPADASDAPSGSAGARSDPVVIEQGVNTIHLNATITSSEQVQEVEVRGWDVADKKAVVSTAPAKTRSAQLPTITAGKIAETFSSPHYVSSRGDGVQRTQEALANSTAERIAGGFAEVEALVFGNAHIHAGTAVSLKGFGAPFDGRYSVTETVHDISSDIGYTTRVIVSNASDRSLYGITAGADAAGGRSSSAMAGVLSGVVTAYGEGEHDGMIHLKFPTLSDDYESSWARIVQPGAGKDRGTLVLPEVGDEVLVAFEGGSLDRPFILGGLYNGVDVPKGGWAASVESGNPMRRSFTSRTGMVVEFSDKKNDEFVRVSTNDGAQQVKLLQTKDKGIEIISEGPVKITAKKDATVISDSGKLLISGDDVEIKAKSKLKLSGGSEVAVDGVSIKLAAQSAAEMTGATLSLKAQATAELAGNAMTTITGGLVKIN